MVQQAKAATCHIHTFCFQKPSFAMLQVLSLAGEQITVLETEEGADNSVKGIKQRLAQKIGFTRFRLRLVIDNRTMEDDEAMSLEVVQLVILDFLPHDLEQDKDMMLVCGANDCRLLEEQLGQPRNPNFEHAGITPLYVAASWGHLRCLDLLLEAGAQTDLGTASTPLYIAAESGRLEIVRILLRAGARIDQDQGTPGGATILRSCSSAAWSCQISGWVPCQHRPSQRRPSNTFMDRLLLGPKLWNFWLSPVPKTKPTYLEERL